MGGLLHKEQTEIKNLASTFTENVLRGLEYSNNCFNVCYALSFYLWKKGFDNSIKSGFFKTNNSSDREEFHRSHFWIVLDKSGFILDPTIKQFERLADLSLLALDSGETVYLGKKRTQFYSSDLPFEANIASINYARETKKSECSNWLVWIRAARIVNSERKNTSTSNGTLQDSIYEDYRKDINEVIWASRGGIKELKYLCSINLDFLVSYLH